MIRNFQVGVVGTLTGYSGNFNVWIDDDNKLISLYPYHTWFADTIHRTVCDAWSDHLEWRVSWRCIIISLLVCDIRIDTRRKPLS